MTALDSISFDIGKGESLGVVGESGSGKSTLGRLVSRLIDPTDGQILFEGTDIGAIRPAAFVHRPERRRIQHIFQDAAENLTPHMTAFTAIADPLRRLGASQRHRPGARACRQRIAQPRVAGALSASIAPEARRHASA